MSAKREILVVEDNEINREILCSILSDDYTVWEAENGQVALDILGMRKSSISLILLDVMMPVMDGYSFLDRIKEDATLALIPVIVMTQGTGEEDELTALSHGATDFVPKPYRPKIIRHRIAALIQLRETAALVNYLQYDRLTGLYCKEYFYKKVQQRLEEDLDGEYCILCANVENFKLVNEIFGARRGENLLKMIADRMRDMIGSRGFCARFGTDRFLALYHGEKGQSSREQLCMLTKQTFDSLPENAVIRCGLYEIDDRMVSAEQMCDRAMLSVDRIKNQYDQHFAVYDDAIRSNMLRDQAITSTMENALNKGQFHMYLQPKFSLNDSCISGAEALVRWIHPNWGFVSPGEFIPLFEKTGFIVRLDQYIWEQACIRLRAWADRGWKPVAISVNVSRVDVFHIDVPEYILGLTRRYGVDPSLLHIEITESAYGEYPEQIISAVEELRNRGFIVEMDDFGSGYSSLNMLSRISLDILKLDMKFTQNELAKPEDQSFLSDVIHMAHRLRLGVVAEGVETREQMNRLQEIGCDYVQGYYFSKPLPIDQFEERMEDWQRSAHDSILQDQRRSALPNSILVADQDGAYRQRICEAFKDQYRMLEAEDAESALAQIEHGDSSGLCAVLLSTILPGGISGVLDMLHQRPSLWGVSVMAVIPGSACVKDNPLAMVTDDFICKEHPIFDVHKRMMRMIENASFRQRICVLQDAARRDPLTGLLNRRGFQDALHAIQSVDMPLAVCVFDLDDLKRINDTMGHHMGDRMLQCFAKQLRSLTRAEDIRCRYGGDEFVAVLKRVNHIENARRKSEIICQRFREMAEEEGCLSSCSVGIAMSHADSGELEEVIARADEALYRAKRDNKGGCCIWTAKP